MTEFIQERDAAIAKCVTLDSWHSFYEFIVEYGLIIPGTCPREKFAMVMLCQYHLLMRKGDTEAAKAVKQAIAQRGFKTSDDERGIINLSEDNRQVDIPDCLKMFDNVPIIPEIQPALMDPVETALPNRRRRPTT